MFGAPAQLVFTQEPGNGTGGTALATQPQVSIEDADGNVLTDRSPPATLAISTNPNGGTLSGCLDTSSAGVISFSGCAIDKVGTGYTLTATDSGDGLTSAPSTAFNITAGTAVQFVVSAPVAATAGVPAIGITLTAEDAGGNTATAYTGNHTITWGGALTSPGGTAPTYPTATVSFTAGASTTALTATLDGAGTNTLTAASSSVAGSATIDVSQAAASKLVYLTAAQTFVAGAAGSGHGSGAITVQLEDTFGNPVAETASTSLGMSTLTGVSYDSSYGGSACSTSTCAIPAGSSTATFYMVDTSASTDAVTTTAGSFSTSSQSEVAETAGTGTGTTVSVSAQSGTLAPTGTATYTVTVTNSGTGTAHFEVSDGGLISSTSSPTSTSCVSIANGSHTTWALTVDNTSGSIPAGTSTFNVVAERFSSTTCGTGTDTYFETSGSLVITPGSAAELAIVTAPVAGSHTGGRTLGPILVQVQDAYGNAVNVGSATTVNLSSSSGTGTFASSSGGGAVTSATIGSGSSFATFYYGDTTAGNPTITTSAGALATWSQKETVS